MKATIGDIKTRRLFECDSNGRRLAPDRYVARVTIPLHARLAKPAEAAGVALKQPVLIHGGAKRERKQQCARMVIGK